MVFRSSRRRAVGMLGSNVDVEDVGEGEGGGEGEARVLLLLLSEGMKGWSREWVMAGGSRASSGAGGGGVGCRELPGV